MVLAAFLALFAVARAGRQVPLVSPASALSGNSEEGVISFQITFGYLRQGPKTYDGSIRLTGGNLRKLDSWRFFQQDAIATDSWKLQIKKVVFENQPDAPNPVAGGGAPARNLVPAGVIATVDHSVTSANIETRSGSFSIPVQQLFYGKPMQFLDGDVLVDRVPTPVPVSSSTVSNSRGEEHDNPSLTVTKAGVLWTAWQAYRDRGDHVYARSADGTATQITEQKADIYRTSVAEDQNGGIHVAWSEHQGPNWFLFERVYDGTSWAARRQIASGHSPNIFHKLVPSAKAPLRLVWVGHDNGQSYLYVSSWDGSAWSAPQRMSEASVWSPDAVSDADGNLLIAWDSYRKGNYDIFFRRIKPDGASDPIEQVTTSARFEAHASIAVDGQGRPWLAWDESGANWGKDWTHEDPNRSTVLYANRSIRVAVKDGGAWKDAPDFGAAVPDRLKRYWQLPHLAADATGRIWAVFQMRSSAVNNRDDFWCAGGLWDLYLTTLENGAWKPAALIPQSTGRNEAAFQIAPGGNRVWFTWSSDGRRFAGGVGGHNAETMSHYNVFQASAGATSAAGDVTLAAFADRAGNPQPVHPNEKDDVARMRNYRASVNGTQYRILRGDFHRHTEISNDGSGDGSVEDYYRYMIDVAEMDTGIIGDHNQGGDVEYSWWRTEKSYDVFHIRNRFTPLFGYERSVPYPNGHRNVVFPQRGTRTLPISQAENQGKINSGPVIYPYLRQARGICMEHSLATGQGTDYRDNDPDLEPLVELYQGYHAGYEYEGAPRAETGSRHVSIHGGYEPAGFWWNALAKGLKLGVQASSDHISTHASYAMIYTPSDDRTQIVESMRQRHAYAATDNIVLDFEAEDSNGKHLMGDAFVSRNTARLTAKIFGTDRIRQIDLIRNNKILFTEKADTKTTEFTYVDLNADPGESYYYIRVLQLDGNLAWSSPIWIKR